MAKTTPEPRIPIWYADIYPDGDRDGFYQRMGNHAVIYVDRGSSQLVVTFDNLAEAGGREYDRDAWAAKFIRDQGWNHLGILAAGPTWFRDTRLISYLENLKSQGFFAQFDRVAMAGASMGGFGALTFAGLAPGCTVVAFSPQISLDTDVVPFETRFPKGRAQDWTLPYSDATQGAKLAGKIYAVYDPMQTEDRDHIDRIDGPNLVRLKAFGMGHRTALVLRRMERLKMTMLGAITGTLTDIEFYKFIRNRKDVFVYRTTMEYYLEQKGQTERLMAFRRAFKSRKRSSK